jgi:hypothetical protein
MITAREAVALGIALAADAVQVVLFPLFGEGFASPLDDGLDALVFALLVAVLGWHPLLLPTLVGELVPFADLAPTWTAAVAIILWRRRRAAGGPPATR